MKILNQSKDEGLRNITINIPYQYDNAIQKLIELEIVPNRSAAIRSALGEYLSKDLKNIEMLNECCGGR